MFARILPLMSQQSLSDLARNVFANTLAEGVLVVEDIRGE